MNIFFREWINQYYNELDNLYNYLIRYTRNSIDKKKFLDNMTKEEFFIFIYKNSRIKYLSNY